MDVSSICLRKGVRYINIIALSTFMFVLISACGENKAPQSEPEKPAQNEARATSDREAAKPEVRLPEVPSTPETLIARTDIYHPPQASDGAQWCDDLEKKIAAGRYGDLPILPVLNQQTISPSCQFKAGMILIEERLSNVAPKGMALDLLRTSAERGNVAALVFLADTYRRGKIISKNEEKAKALEQTAIARGWDPKASYIFKGEQVIKPELIEFKPDGKSYLPFDYFLKGAVALIRGTREEAEALFRQGAALGNAKSFYELALMHKDSRATDPQSVANYRLAAFYGSRYAHQNLAVYAMRSFASKQVLMAPEGEISGAALIDFAVSHLNAAALMQSQVSKEYLLRLLQFLAESSATPIDPDTISGAFKSFLVNSQPAGHRMPSLFPTQQSSWNPFSCLRICKHGLEHIENEIGTPLDLKIYGRENFPLIVSAMEIWDPVSGTRIAHIPLNLSDNLAQTSICASWYDQGCQGKTVATISLKNLKSGFYVYRLVSPAGVPFQPTPIYLYEGANASVLPQSKLGVCNNEGSASTAKTILVIHPTFTWQAYEIIGGGSLYLTPLAEKAFAVNTARPITSAIGPTHHNYRSVLPVARMLCQEGYNIAHITGAGLERLHPRAGHYQAMVVAGHDEYWSEKTGNTLRSYVKNGGALVVLSGNTGWGQVEHAKNNLLVNRGKPESLTSEAITKHPWLSQFDLSKTGLTMAKHVDHPVEQFMGVTYESGGYALQDSIKKTQITEFNIDPVIYANSQNAYVIDPNHPVFKGLALTMGEPFCADSRFLFQEMDSTPLIGPDFVPNHQWLPKANRKTKALAAAYIHNRNVPALNNRMKSGQLHFSGFIVDAPYGEKGGRVVTVGSMGAFRLAFAREEKCQTLLKNIFQYVASDAMK
jgi:hypothetical protein